MSSTAFCRPPGPLVALKTNDPDAAGRAIPPGRAAHRAGRLPVAPCRGAGELARRADARAGLPAPGRRPALHLAEPALRGVPPRHARRRAERHRRCTFTAAFARADRTCPPGRAASARARACSPRSRATWCVWKPTGTRARRHRGCATADGWSERMAGHEGIHRCAHLHAAAGYAPRGLRRARHGRRFCTAERTRRHAAGSAARRRPATCRWPCSAPMAART